jgi:hypothetical protein
MVAAKIYTTVRAASIELGISHQDLAVIIRANGIPTVELVKRAAGSVCGLTSESLDQVRPLVTRYLRSRSA